jgi:hypothetical protein
LSSKSWTVFSQKFSASRQALSQSLQKLAKQGDREAVGEALVAEGNESRAACHLVARGSVGEAVVGCLSSCDATR